MRNYLTLCCRNISLDLGRKTLHIINVCSDDSPGGSILLQVSGKGLLLFNRRRKPPLPQRLIGQIRTTASAKYCQPNNYLLVLQLLILFLISATWFGVSPACKTDKLSAAGNAVFRIFSFHSHSFPPLCCFIPQTWKCAKFRTFPSVQQGLIFFRKS